MCIGNIDKLRRLERSERRLNYHIIKGWADPKKFNKSMEQWWPISGDITYKIKVPTKRMLLKYNDIFKNLGNRKNG